MAVGIVSIALVLPISLFVLRCKPEEMGLLPYGAEDVEQRAVSDASAPASGENGITLKELLRQPEFYIAVGAYWTSVSWNHKDLRIFHCAGVLWSCAAVHRFPEDCDGRFSVLRRDIAAFLGHDAVILQDLLEGRDIQHGVRLLHYGGNASRRPVQHVVWNIL